jgi:CheY-like chemotaxis protein
MRAEAATVAKSQFLANMSHEIRTPLTAIIGYADFAQGDEIPIEEKQRALEAILSNGRHLLSVINDILDLSKIDANAMTFEAVTLSPRSLVEEVCEILRDRAEAKDLAVQTIFDKSLPSSIQADPVRLKQVLINLIGNAIKFTERGQVEIQAHYDISAERMEFSIRDTGLGLTAEQITRLFQPFTQADVSTTRRFGGTGLGLAISAEIVRRMGGRIQVKSEPGIGSLFSFHISCPKASLTWNDDVEIVLPDSLETPTQKLDSDLLHLHGRVLVADDAKENRMLMEFILRKSSIDLHLVTNGQEALDMALESSFDLVLMDMNMPEIDGHEATTRLRAAGIETPIVAFTADASEFEVARCLKSGCSAHLAKPFRKSELIAMLSEFLPASGELLKTS